MNYQFYYTHAPVPMTIGTKVPGPVAGYCF